MWPLDELEIDDVLANGTEYEGDVFVKNDEEAADTVPTSDTAVGDEYLKCPNGSIVWNHNIDQLSHLVCLNTWAWLKIFII